MLYTLVDRLTILSPLALLVGICLGIYKFRTLNQAHRILFFYLVLCLAFDVLTRLPVWMKQPNLILLVLFSLFELLLFYVLYRQWYSNKKHPVLLVIVPVGIGYILWELFTTDFRNASGFQSYAKVVDTVCIMAMAVGYFFDELQHPSHTMGYFFRLNSVLLICFSFYIVFFIPINFLIEQNTSAQLYLWLVHLLVTVGLYIYITIELCRNGKTRRQLPFG